VRNHPPKAPSITEVIWQPPPLCWVKCNSNDASKGNPGPLACGGIFRDNQANDLGCFASNFGICDAFSAELIGAITAIEIAQRRGWNHLWLECDSKLVTLTFKSQLAIPWKLRNRWNNCLFLVRNMYFVVSHIYREGNRVADKLANLGFGINDSLWFDSCSMVFRSDLVSNRLDLPNFRFS
jgi:ribonuclease HI